MRRLSALFVGIVLGGGIVYFGFNFHLIRAQSGWIVVSKSNAALSDACVDIRNWKLADWRAHPDLARNMIKAGYSDTVKAALKDSLIDEAVKGLTRMDQKDEVIR